MTEQKQLDGIFREIVEQKVNGTQKKIDQKQNKSKIIRHNLKKKV